MAGNGHDAFKAAASPDRTSNSPDQHLSLSNRYGRRRSHWEVERRRELGMQTALQWRSLGCGAAPPYRRLNPVRSNAP
jgi:hypothetical protein